MLVTVAVTPLRINPYIISSEASDAYNELYDIFLGLSLPAVLVTDSVIPSDSLTILKWSFSSADADIAVLLLLPISCDAFFEYNITTSLFDLTADVKVP